MALDNVPSEPEPDLDLVAASLRADGVDTRTFLETVAVKLEDALPGSVVVKRAKEGFRGPKLVREITVTTSDGRLELRHQGHDVEALRARVSGGITIKSERIDMDTWIAELAELLSSQARRSQQTREALARLLDAP